MLKKEHIVSLRMSDWNAYKWNNTSESDKEKEKWSEKKLNQHVHEKKNSTARWPFHVFAYKIRYTQFWMKIEFIRTNKF